MKIRTGFVSNSSSSSFICNAFDYEGYEPKELTVEIVISKLKTMIEMYNKMEDTNLSYEDAIGSVGLGDEEIASYLKGYGQHGYSIGDRDWTLDDIKNKIVIMSAGDNAIPYELFELIKSSFDAERVHLG